MDAKYILAKTKFMNQPKGNRKTEVKKNKQERQHPVHKK